MMTASSPRRALLIAGPTASGKSALAIRLARERKGAIVNADALQVYGELRILTARPSPEEEAEVPHRLYGHISGRESYSAGHWLKDAAATLAAAWGEGLLPIVVGGTGLYFRALERGIAEVPAIAPEVRRKWREFPGDLHGELGKRDPELAARLGSNDRQRLIRGLEVIEATGKSLGHWRAEATGSAPLAAVAVERIMVEVPREELYARAETRFEAMLEAGALDEARAVAGLDPALPMMKAIGVPELLAHLRGELSLDDAVVRAKAATRQYIKRQFTWWRGQGKDWQRQPPGVR